MRDICFNNTGTQFLSAAYDRYLKLWDTETGEKKTHAQTLTIRVCDELFLKILDIVCFCFFQFNVLELNLEHGVCIAHTLLPFGLLSAPPAGGTKHTQGHSWISIRY